MVHALFALLIWCVLVVQSSSVLHSDRVALFRFVDAIAFADQSLRDTHVGKSTGLSGSLENVRCGGWIGVG